MIELFEQTLRNEAVGRVLGKGYSPADYTLLCYGGGGPLHVAGYTEGVAYRDVLVPAWAAGFSAYGCACADFEYRYDQTIDYPIEPAQDELEKAGIAIMITGAWLGLQDRVADEFAKSGIDREAISSPTSSGCSTSASSTTSRSSRPAPSSMKRSTSMS